MWSFPALCPGSVWGNVTCQLQTDESFVTLRASGKEGEELILAEGNNVNHGDAGAHACVQNDDSARRA